MAMVMDRAQGAKQGSAQATFAAFVQLGHMLGALLSGFVSDWAGYTTLYLVSLAPLAIAMALLVLDRTHRSGRFFLKSFLSSK
jgi:predicted MFS family arabinose efflux permease